MKEGVSYTSFQPALTGRDNDISKLESFWTRTKEGKGSTVFISGEAGIGKTRLVSEFMDMAEERETMIIKGWCLSESLEPLLPLRNGFLDAGIPQLISEDPPPKVISTYLIKKGGILVAKSEREDTDLDSDIFATMLSAVSNFVTDSLKMMKEQGTGGLNTIGYGKHNILIHSRGDLSLATVIEGSNYEFLIDDMNNTLDEIGNTFDDWDGDMNSAEIVKPKISWFIDSRKYEGRYLVDDPKIKQENLFYKVLLGLRRLSDREPIILFIDDLQWADPTTLKLIHYLSRNTKNNSILILGTYRPEDIVASDDGKTHNLKTTMQNMSRENLYEEIKLMRLDKKFVKKLIESTLRKIDIGHGLVKKIYGECEGNPLFLLEIIEMMVAEGYLTKKNDFWEERKDIDEINIPSKVYDVVMRRLDRLISDQRNLLECASVIGKEFESEIIGEVTGINRIRILKDLNEIERTHNLIHSIKKKYRFDHNKFREVLYNSINEELREEYHLMIAESYEKLYPNNIDKVEPLLAHHYYKAEDERAIEYLLSTGDKAKERYANDEALVLYDNAISLAKEKDIDVPTKALEGLGDVYNVIGDYDKALESYEEALDIVKDKEKAVVYGKIANIFEKIGGYEDSLEYAEKGISLVDPDDIEMCSLLNVKGWGLLRKGEYDEAIKVFKKSEEKADMLDRKLDKGQAQHNLGTIYLRKGEFDEGKEYLEKAIKLRDDCEDINGLGVSYNNMALIYWNKGELEHALQYFTQCIDIFENIGHKFGVATALNNIGVIKWIKGELDSALDHYKRSRCIQEEIGDKLGIATSLHNIAAIYRDKGDLDTSLNFFKKSLSNVEEIGDKWGIAKSLSNVGVVYSLMGELDRSIDCLEHSLQIREEMGDKTGIIESLCGITETYIKKEEIMKAEENARRALQIAIEVGGKNEMTMSHKLLGMVYREQERWDESRAEFEKGIEMLDGKLDKKDLSIAYYEYGLMWKEMGEKKKAKEYLEKSLEIFEDIGMKLMVKEAKEELKSI